MKKGPVLISNLAGFFTTKKHGASTQGKMRAKYGITYQLTSIVKVKVAVGCIALVSLLLTGCYQQFYASGTKEPPATRDLVNVRDWDKEIILHFEDSIIHLQQMALNNDTLAGLPMVQIPHEKIQRLDVYERDGTATAVNYTLSTLGIIICIALPVLLLVASFSDNRNGTGTAPACRPPAQPGQGGRCLAGFADVLKNSPQPC